MMFVHNEQEIREWILDGIPERLAKKEAHRSSSAAAETTQEAETDSPTVDMPAFRGIISSDDLENLVAYFKAIAVFDRIPEAAKPGYDVARRTGCFGCHGWGGRVGSVNPRSLKGYIPPWHGKDFAELVKNDAELREWILKGRIARFESNPVARFFTRRQVIRMPAYEDILQEEEIDELAAYIDWLQTTGP
jgi:mono/diheme cytochrome c family protein